MKYELIHHKKFYDGIWILTLCILAIPPTIIGIISSKNAALVLFIFGVLFGVLPVFIVMQIKKHAIKKLYKKTKEENGTVSFEENTKYMNDVIDKNGKIYKLCGAYGTISKNKYKCKFVHNKKCAWLTYIEK